MDSDMSYQQESLFVSIPTHLYLFMYILTLYLYPRLHKGHAIINCYIGPDLSYYTTVINIHSPIRKISRTLKSRKIWPRELYCRNIYRFKSTTFLWQFFVSLRLSEILKALKLGGTPCIIKIFITEKLNYRGLIGVWVLISLREVSEFLVNFENWRICWTGLAVLYYNI